MAQELDRIGIATEVRTPSLATLAGRSEYDKDQRDHRWLAAIVESSHDAIIGRNLDGTVVSWNQGAEDLFGYKAEEVIGGSLARLMPPDRQDEEGEIIARVRLGERIHHFETVRVRKDGALVDVSLMISPLRDEHGVIVGNSKIARDITESKRDQASLTKAMAQLEQANNELEGFSYSVSHDLRAPLRAIHGFAHLLEEEAADRLGDEDRRLIAAICTNASMMGRLIDDLLSFSRISRRAIEPAPVDMEALARDAYAEAVADAPGRAIEFKLAALPQVCGDPVMLRQVFANLLSNAVKYTRPRAKAVIEVTGMIEGPQAHFSVRDNGVGYNAKYAHKLFGVFQRLHSASEFEGTGIGLSLVRRVVERHGGQVWSSSELNEGSLFEFTLPTGEADSV